MSEEERNAKEFYGRLNKGPNDQEAAFVLVGLTQLDSGQATTGSTAKDFYIVSNPSAKKN